MYYRVEHTRLFEFSSFPQMHRVRAFNLSSSSSSVIIPGGTAKVAGGVSIPAMLVVVVVVRGIVMVTAVVCCPVDGHRCPAVWAPIKASR